VLIDEGDDECGAVDRVKIADPTMSCSARPAALALHSGPSCAEVAMEREIHEALLTLDEVGERLGTGVRFARHLVAERRIRFVKVGRHVRIPAGAVHDFIEAATVQAMRPSRR
jgi:excisionase family DNA binding protein